MVIIFLKLIFNCLICLNYKTKLKTFLNFHCKNVMHCNEDKYVVCQLIKMPIIGPID